MADTTDSVTPLAMITPPSTTPSSRTLPIREDCWSDEATSTLIDVWGRRYVELNRGNLRQKDWQDVADAVNALHAHTKKTHRTDVQYITEALAEFFTRDPRSPPVALPLPLPYRTTLAPATVVSLPQKRPAVDDGCFNRNYSAVAAAAAAVESDEEEGEESQGEESEGEREEKKGMKSLARAIERLGQVYERVEGEKLRQMVELEKQRMQFAKDLEVQRMKMFMETQVQFEKIKRGKRSLGSSGEAYYSS
ncbi:Sequence-specific DNA binding transcription factors isoform 2 [Hibiscus syriacus]|uniref:Sequence-specific DNA binding transcription factors isoform 2 n=1 Tax=Hibiscus syriacus TaxID=106335 RepID=A0A6A2YCW4_HIBSY|nr:Sequence-specific DNA binding transcription factors isoform 2 [Hibiscus syriacus]